jgi:hypothetical protein
VVCAERADDYSRSHGTGTPTCSTDCSEVPHGICSESGGFMTAPYCRSGCLDDSECSPGEVCACSQQGGICVRAGCASDADCQSPFHCAWVEGPCGLAGWACQRPEDECVSSQDCSGAYCFDFGQGHRSCTNAACGRPFLVASQPRHAPAVARSDWLLRPLT